MFFTGLLYGMTYYAWILPTNINGEEEYHLDVYTMDVNGQRHPDFSGVYRTRKGAEKALRRRYPEGRWCAR